MNDLSSVYLRLTALWRRKGDRVIIYSDAHFDLVRLELNDVAGQIWELLDGQRSVEDIMNLLVSSQSDVNKEEIAEGVFELIDNLRQEWLVMSRREIDTYE